MELLLLIAALVLFIIAAVWGWRGEPRITLIAAGLACWVATNLVSRL